MRSNIKDVEKLLKSWRKRWNNSTKNKLKTLGTSIIISSIESKMITKCWRSMSLRPIRINELNGENFEISLK